LNTETKRLKAKQLEWTQNISGKTKNQEILAELFKVNKTEIDIERIFRQDRKKISAHLIAIETLRGKRKSNRVLEFKEFEVQLKKIGTFKGGTWLGYGIAAPKSPSIPDQN